jgi:catechol 2,3-dioxygenase-like lactoylglutathione lyase family enzyme
VVVSVISKKLSLDVLTLGVPRAQDALAFYTSTFSLAAAERDNSVNLHDRPRRSNVHD